MTMGGDDFECVVRVRGLPWSASAQEIMNFFDDCKVRGGANGIHMTLSREGRPSGEAYVELETKEDVEKALTKHNEHMGHRYIEVFQARKSEMEWVVNRSGTSDSSMYDGCVRLRGLPFGCSKEEIAQFFSGLEIVPNGITLPMDFQGRTTGEAYVQFATKDIAEKALGKHKEKIGHRYIEIFRSSLSEIRGSAAMPRLSRGGMTQRPSPYDRTSDRFGASRFRAAAMSRSFRGYMDDDFDRFDGWGGARARSMGASGMGAAGGARFNNFDRGFGGGSGHFVHMRGLPFRAAASDVTEFFRPLVPVNVNLIYEDNGRASGEADIEFGTHEEAVKAMSKDKAHMQHRYIELFLNSTPEDDNFGGMGGGVAGNGNYSGNQGMGGNGSMAPGGYGAGGAGMGSYGSAASMKQESQGGGGPYGSRYGGGAQGNYFGGVGGSGGGMGGNASGGFGSGYGGGMGGGSAMGGYSSGSGYGSGGGGGAGGAMMGNNYNSF